MADTIPAPTPPVKRPFFRYWLPRLVVLAAAIVVALLWLLPESDTFERQQRIVGTLVTIQATLLLLAGWLLFFSGFRWWVRLGTLLLVVACLWAAFKVVVRDVSFRGDMQPKLIFRWAPQQDDLLERHRQRQGGAAPAVISEIKPTDYPEYRGRNRDGVVIGPALARDWKAQPPKLLWKQPCGGGYASFAVVGDLAVTIEQRRDQEAIVGYDTATGRERWLHPYPALFHEQLGGDGPRATPTLAGDEVYSLGATGVLVCLDAATGGKKWSVNILEGNDNLQWAMSGSPLVYDNLVVVNPGKQRETADGSLVAHDRATGKPVWRSGTAPAGYSSPMLTTLAGKRQILLFDGAGVAGYDAAGGRQLWRYEFPTYQGINAMQPLVLDGDRVFISSGYEAGSVMLHVTAGEKWTVQELWKNRNLRCKFTSPVAYQGHIYGLDEGILACLDEKTGERKWKAGRYGHGQLLRADDLLVILSESGKLVLVEASPEGHHELGSLDALTGKAEKTWNLPALANGKAFVRNHQEMACYDLTGR